MIVFPPEKASRYKSGVSPVVIQIPEGFNAEWLSNMLRSAMPGLKISVMPGKNDKLVILGPEDQISDVFIA
jgi:hypothetical protein